MTVAPPRCHVEQRIVEGEDKGFVSDWTFEAAGAGTRIRIAARGALRTHPLGPDAEDGSNEYGPWRQPGLLLPLLPTDGPPVRRRRYAEARPGPVAHARGLEAALRGRTIRTNAAILGLLARGVAPGN